MSSGFNSLNKAPEKKKVTVEDRTLFGDKLKEARNRLEKSTKKNVALKLGVDTTSINFWETGETFPDESRLPDIAQAYNIDLNELTGAFKISKEARELEKNSRKKPKPITNKWDPYSDDY